MRKIQWIIALFLTVTLGLSPALAAEAAQQTPAAEPSKLETISGKQALKNNEHDDCPMHHDKKKCMHKDGEPCPLHDKGHDHKKNHDHSHEKCDHKPSNK